MVFSRDFMATIVAAGITAGALGFGRFIDQSISRNAAIQTVTLAELTGPNAPAVLVGNTYPHDMNPLPETFYVRADGTRCYLAIDKKAVPNTCYQNK